MTEAFPVSGNIDPAAFPHLLVDLHRHGATGSLKVTGPAHPKALYFRNGRILFGSSNDPRDQLGAILIENGKITREQLDQVTAKVGPGNPLAKVLSDSGFVTQRELGDAARVKVERILADLLSWDSGTFEFEDGVLPKGAVDLKLSSEKLLLAAVQRIPDRGFALRHLGLSTVLEPVPEGEAALSEIRGEVWPLLERLDGHRSLKDAIALTRLDEFEAAKTACALLFLGVVRAKPDASPELDLAREAQSAFGAEEGEAPLFTVPLTSVSPPPAPAPPPPGEQEQPEPFVASPPPPPFERRPSTPPPAEEQEEPEPPAPVATPELPPEAPTFILPSSRVASPPPPPPPPPPAVPSEPVRAQAPEPPPPAYAPPAYQPEPTLRMPAAPPPPEPEPQVAFSPPPPPYSPPPPPYSPPAPEPEPPGAEEPPPSGAPEPRTQHSRPSQADLAALDALLHPSASGRAAPAPQPAARRADNKWEPQFRPPQPARVQPARTRARSSHLPLIVLTVLAAVVLTSAAAWYLLLGRPKTGPTPAVTQHRPAPAAPPSAGPRTMPATPSPSAAAPNAAATVPAAAPTTASRPTPAPATPQPERPSAVARDGTPPGATRADPTSLLQKGSLPEAARAFASSLATGPRTRHTVQLLTACAPQTVEKAVTSAGGGELFITPVQLNGRACYRVCWGVYPDRQSAEAALGSVPAYYRQGGARPRVSPLAEILP